jgi:hypothetical protein
VGIPDPESRVPPVSSRLTFLGLCLAALLCAVLPGQVRGQGAFVPEPDRRSLALIIGNQDYRGDTPDVDYALNDMEDFAAYFRDVAGLPANAVFTRSNLGSNDLAQLFGKPGVRRGRGQLHDLVFGVDHLYVVYSGHGVPALEGGRGYLLPVDANPQAPEFGGYPLDVLVEQLAALPVARVTLILDACFSGLSAAGALVPGTSGVFGVAVAPPVPRAKVAVLSATDYRQPQFAHWNAEAENGVFSWYLLKGLHGEADLYGDGDGRIRLRELHDYLRMQVVRHTFARGSQQTPSLVASDDPVLLDFGGQTARPVFEGKAPLAATPVAPDAEPVAPNSADFPPSYWETEVFALSGLGGAVLSAAFSPDGKRFVTGSVDGTAQVWETATGRRLATLTGHGGYIAGVGFSPDGARVVTAGSDRTVRTWVASGRPLTTLRGHDTIVSAAAFSPDGGQIVTASWDKTARIWDALSGEVQRKLSGHEDQLRDAAFSPDSTRIVTASMDGTARVWDVLRGRSLMTFSGHRDWVNSAAFSPDGTRVVTASRDGRALVWDVSTGQVLIRLDGFAEEVRDAAYSPDGTRIVTGSGDGTARVWDAQSGLLLATLTGHLGAVLSVAFSPDGTRILTASRDGTARVWGGAVSRSWPPGR